MVSGGHTLTFSGFSTLTGGGTDSLVAQDAAANAWAINTVNGGSVTGGIAFTYTGMSSLTAGTGGDSFTFTGTGAESNVNGGTGSDSIDTSGLGAATVDLTANSASGYTGTSTVGPANFTAIDSFKSAAGGTLTSSLAAGATAWSITAANAGSLTNSTFGFGFTNFSTLNGDNNGDSFTFTGTGAESNVNGGTGSDSIDTSGLAAAATVNLTASGANGFGGTSTVGPANFTNI